MNKFRQSMAALFVLALVMPAAPPALSHTINPDGSICEESSYWMPPQAGYWTTLAQQVPSTASFPMNAETAELVFQPVWVEAVPAACIPCPNPWVTWGFGAGALAFAIVAHFSTGGISTAATVAAWGSAAGGLTWEARRLIANC